MKNDYLSVLTLYIRLTFKKILAVLLIMATVQAVLNLFVGGFLRAAFVFKDGKLGACTNYLSISEDGGNENFIGIYDKDGLRYLGKIRSSLLSSCFVYDISADGYDVKLSLR